MAIRRTTAPIIALVLTPACIFGDSSTGGGEAGASSWGGGTAGTESAGDGTAVGGAVESVGD